MTDVSHPDDSLGANARLEALREAIARRARDCGREPEFGHAGRRLQDLFRRRGLADDRARRPDAVRREPGAGGGAQMAGAARPRRRARQDDRIASDRPAAEQQGARGGRDSSTSSRPSTARRSRPRSPRRSSGSASSRGCSSRSTPGPSRRRPASCPSDGGRLSRPLPRRIRPGDRGADGDSAGRRTGLAAFRACSASSPRATASANCRWA